VLFRSVVIDEITKFIRDNGILHFNGVTNACVEFEVNKNKYTVIAQADEDAESDKEPV
jgi:hypothetical protein